MQPTVQCKKLDRAHGYTLWEKTKPDSQRKEIFLTRFLRDCIYQREVTLPEQYKVDSTETEISLREGFNFEGVYGRYSIAVQEFYRTQTQDCATPEKCEAQVFTKMQKSVFVSVPFEFNGTSLREPIAFAVGRTIWEAKY